MDVLEILTILRRLEPPFPRAALEAARARREEVTPFLLRILEETVENAEALREDEGYGAHVFALFLLSEFGEAKAHAPIGRLLRLSSDALEDLLGDMTTSNAHQFLASTWDGEDAVIRGLIEDPEVDEWVRASAMTSLVTLWALGKKSREEIEGYFLGLAEGGLEEEPSEAWNALARIAADLAIPALVPFLRRAYESDLVDPTTTRLSEMEADALSGKPPGPEAAAEIADYRPLSSVEEEMSGWDCFDPDRDEMGIEMGWADEGEEAPGEVRGFGLYEPPRTVVRESPKIGRNEPCPCGSGKKYKKCCGPSESAAQRGASSEAGEARRAPGAGPGMPPSGRRGSAGGRDVLGYAWYPREQWDRWREVCTDGADFEENYEEWVDYASGRLIELKEQGFDVRKVDMDLDVWVRWCRQRGLPLNGKSRSRYAAEMVGPGVRGAL